MDPNTALDELRAFVLERPDRHTRTHGGLLVSADRASDAFEALDEWLSRGGFLPDDWHRNKED